MTLTAYSVSSVFVAEPGNVAARPAVCLARNILTAVFVGEKVGIAAIVKEEHAGPAKVEQVAVIIDDGRRLIVQFDLNACLFPVVGDDGFGCFFGLVSGERANGHREFFTLVIRENSVRAFFPSRFGKERGSLLSGS